MTSYVGVDDLSPWQFDMYVEAEADGVATPEQLAVLEANTAAWRIALLGMLRDAEEHVASARSLPGEERDQVVADLESELRRLSAAFSRFAPERTSGQDARRARATPTDAGPATVRRPRPDERSCRCRGNRGASWRGPADRTRPSPTVTRSWRCSRPPARRKPAGAHTRRCRCREASTRIRSAFRSVTCWDGSSPPAPTRWATTSVRASGGSGASRSGRSSSPLMVRWCRSCGSERGRARARVSRTVPTRCDGPPRSSIRRGSNAWPPRCPEACAPSTARSTPAPSSVRRSPAWWTRSVATARAGSRFPRPRHAFVPHTMSRKRSSPASTGARSMRRSRLPARS